MKSLVIDILLLFAITALLLGCSNTQIAKLDLSAPSARTIFVKDNRPTESKLKSKVFGASGAYITLGDLDVDPAPLVLIQKWASSSEISIPANSELVLNEFTISYYEPDTAVDQKQLEQARQSTPGASPLAGLLAGWLIEGIEGIRKEKPVTFKMTGLINGKPFEANASGSFKGKLSAEDIGSIIALGLKNATDSISGSATSYSSKAQ